MGGGGGGGVMFHCGFIIIIIFIFFTYIKLANLKLSTKQAIKDVALKLWKLFCCVFHDDCAKYQACVIMVAKERCLKTNIVSYFSRFS